MAVLALLGSVHRTKRRGPFAHHRDPGDADALDLGVAHANSLRLPSLAVALDVDVAVPIGSPRMHRKQKAVAGVAVARLELPANVAGEKIARDMRRAEEEQPSLPLACGCTR